MPIRFHSIAFVCILAFISIQNGICQSVAPVSFDLNSGARVIDVAKSDLYKEYILVGDFSSIGGQSRNSLAVIDSASMSLKPYNPITSINGDIHGVAVLEPFIYICGDFTQVNGVPQMYISRFESVGFPFFAYIHNPIPQDSTLGGDPLMQPSGLGSDGVYDILFLSDTLICAGQFQATNSTGTILGTNFFSYKANASFTPLEHLDHTTSGTWPIGRYLHCHNDIIYALGDDLNGVGTMGNMVKFQRDGTQMPFTPWWPTGSHADKGGHGIAVHDSFDLLAVKSSQHLLGQTGLTTFLLDENSQSEHPLTLLGGGNRVGIIFYDSNILSLRINDPGAGGNDFLSLYSFLPADDTATTISSLSISDLDETLPVVSKRMFLLDDLLLLSDPTLTNVSGANRQGLSIITLPPHSPSAFIVGESTPCQGASYSYSISFCRFATGYRWECLGSGVEINGQDICSGGVELMGSSNNQVVVNFLPGATASQLIVTPFGRFGEYSSSSSFNINSVLPRPQPIPFPDSTLTCSRDSITLLGQCPGAASFQWEPPQGNQVLDPTISASQEGDYVLIVIDTNGCVNSDTVTISYDTITPTISFSVDPAVLSCEQDTLFLSALPSTSRARIQWRNPMTQTLFPDSVPVSTPNTWTAIITDTVNDCVDSSELLVILDAQPPSFQLFSHPYMPGVAVDTITCTSDSILLVGGSLDSNTLVYWTDSSLQANLDDSIWAISQGTYFLYARDSSNGCSDFLPVLLTEYFTPPPLISGSLLEFNCSNQDSVMLGASTAEVSASIEWNGPNTYANSDTIWVYSPGSYTVTATSTANGCETIDTLHLTQSNAIDVSAGNDTIACLGDSLTFSGSYLGNFNNPSFLWSNGSTSLLAHTTASPSGFLLLSVSADTCAGLDTVFFDIPITPTTSVQSYSPCGSDSSGQLIISASGGLGPYSFSLDGIGFQSSPVFTGLPFGQYNIVLRDILGCRYESLASIDQNSALPSPLFLAPTYNAIGDTIALVDVSDPPGDSVKWHIPANILILNGEGPYLEILPVDTGVFQVVMDVYYGTCLSSTSKNLFVGQTDSSSATLFNSNGIAEFILYPNPSDGNFSVRVVFQMKQSSTIWIGDMNGMRLFYLEQPELLEYELPISLDPTLPSGSYPIRVVSEFDAKHGKVILTR